jgi:hypothetical protein
LPLLKKIENATAYMDEMFPHATYLEKNKPVQLRPTHCIKMFEKSLKYIEKICTKFNDKKIVLITHHCVSGKAILPKYKTYINNPAITTDIEDFIKKFPNIKLIIHGHTHGKCDYFIHGIPVICNPLGVIDKGEDEGFNKDLFVDI